PVALQGLSAASLSWDMTEDDDAFTARVAAGAVAGRVRVLGALGPDDGGAPELYWRAQTAPDSDATLLAQRVLTSGRRELLTVLREQAISQTMHRFGHLEQP
ncbi:MAG TPA: hypothetical protein VK095_05700, partial [Beutenbergiaceae bacterium]|nr:hypothetical protein [Beutenbergiaceae bacterium]